MARIRYENWTPGPDALAAIRRSNDICAEYAEQGYDLTLRQLYYQHVARGFIPNTQRDYKRLGDIINKARLAGLLDWDYIVDRTRNLKSVGHWQDPSSIVSSAARSFRLDKWVSQPTRVEVWVEKEALAGVIERTADARDVAWFSCRGYVSQSEMWAAARRHLGYIKNGQNVVILHLGDHDPSGIDMTRDIHSRLMSFISQDWLNLSVDAFPAGATVKVRDIMAHAADTLDGRYPIEVRRIALNYDQVEEYDPPPNPAKTTDARANAYIAEHGYESWELDALDPATLDALVQEAIDGIIEPDAYDEIVAEERQHRELLELASDRWGSVVEMLNATEEDAWKR